MKKSIFAMLVLLALLATTMTACADAPGTDDPVTDPAETTDPAADQTESTEKPTIFVVGDSTVNKDSDPSFYYPCVGYGVALENYVADGVKVVNLGLAGSSSKSYKMKEEYYEFLGGIKEGDYLIISFGHNDEKSEDSDRFTDASKSYTEHGSFGYYLNKYYIERAREKGATPILCTPIVRASANDDYTGSCGHITATGDYRQAILDLAEACDVPVVDMTSITRARYEELGFEKACLYHGVQNAKYAEDGVTVLFTGIDTTHLNIYGANYMAYRLSSELKNIEGVGKFIADNLTEPTEELLVPGEESVILPAG